MEAIIARIKGYVLVLSPSILADLGMTDAQLNFAVASVVDRVLAYTNRQQLVTQYEADLDDEEVEVVDYELPIPTEIERALASTIVASMKSINDLNSAELGSIKSVSDNGQSVTYGDKLMSFFNSSSDADIFSSTTELLKKYILATVVIEPTNELQNYDCQNVL